MKYRRKALGIAVSLAGLAGLYSTLDIPLMMRAVVAADPSYVVLGTAMLAPIFAAMAYRFRALLPEPRTLTWLESLRLTLVATALNTFLPAKLGDVSKCLYVARAGHAKAGAGLSVVVFERLADVVALVSLCLIGLLLDLGGAGKVLSLRSVVAITGIWIVAVVVMARADVVVGALDAARRSLPRRLERPLGGVRDGWAEMSATSDGRRARALALSIGLWIVHLAQIWVFILAVGGQMRFIDTIALSGLALLAGVVPLTFAGAGVRDVALVYLFADHLTAERAAAVGLLCLLRTFVPALAALPFLSTTPRPAGPRQDSEGAGLGGDRLRRLALTPCPTDYDKT